MDVHLTGRYECDAAAALAASAGNDTAPMDLRNQGRAMSAYNELYTTHRLMPCVCVCMRECAACVCLYPVVVEEPCV